MAYTDRLGTPFGYYPLPPKTYGDILRFAPRVKTGLLWPIAASAVRQPVGFSEPFAVRPATKTGQTWPRNP